MNGIDAAVPSATLASVVATVSANDAVVQSAGPSTVSPPFTSTTGGSRSSANAATLSAASSSSLFVPLPMIVMAIFYVLV